MKTESGEIHPSRQQTTHTCAVCQSPIVDGHWFCRLPNDEVPTLFCSPACALRCFNRSHADKNGSSQDWDSYEARGHFFVNGELWA
jgi:hypothetical protein